MGTRTTRARGVNRCLTAVVEPIERRLFLSTSWFVATTGSDQNPGTLAAPLHTIQKAASQAHAGDTVYIRGGVYRETVTPANSGAASAPITFTNYNNEIVTVSGADPITGWTSIGNGKFSAAQSWDLGEGNNELFVDGKTMY